MASSIDQSQYYVGVDGLTELKTYVDNNGLPDNLIYYTLERNGFLTERGTVYRLATNKFFYKNSNGDPFEIYMDKVKPENQSRIYISRPVASKASVAIENSNSNSISNSNSNSNSNSKSNSNSSSVEEYWSKYIQDDQNKDKQYLYTDSNSHKPFFLGKFLKIVIKDPTFYQTLNNKEISFSPKLYEFEKGNLPYKELDTLRLADESNSKSVSTPPETIASGITASGIASGTIASETGTGTGTIASETEPKATKPSASALGLATKATKAATKTSETVVTNMTSASDWNATLTGEELLQAATKYLNDVYVKNTDTFKAGKYYVLDENSPRGYIKTVCINIGSLGNTVDSCKYKDSKGTEKYTKEAWLDKKNNFIKPASRSKYAKYNNTEPGTQPGTQAKGGRKTNKKQTKKQKTNKKRNKKQRTNRRKTNRRKTIKNKLIN